MSVKLKPQQWTRILLMLRRTKTQTGLNGNNLVSNLPDKKMHTVAINLSEHKDKYYKQLLHEAHSQIDVNFKT